MDKKEQIELVRAFIKVSDAMGAKEETVGAVLKLFFEDGFKVIQDAAETYNEFAGSDIVKRGEMLGIEITTTR